MKIRITAPQHISATIQLPSSKSISNRALIINALAKGVHCPENLSDCDDTQVMLQALEAKEGNKQANACRNSLLQAVRQGLCDIGAQACC